MSPVRRSLALATVALSACTAPDLAPDWRWRGFAVLGVRATPLEPRPGDTVALALATADTQMGRPVAVRWFRCDDRVPGAAPNATPAAGELVADCPRATPLDGTDIALGFVVPTAGGVPETLASGRGVADHQTFRVAGLACAGGALGDPLAGDARPTCDGGVGVLFTYVVDVRAPQAADVPNEPPGFASLTFGPEGGTAQDWLDATTPAVPRCTEGNEDQFAARPGCPVYVATLTLAVGSDASFTLADGSLATESLTTRLLVDHGSLDTQSASDPTLSAPGQGVTFRWRAPPDAGPVIFLWLVEDDRGGFTQIERQLAVN